MCRFASLLWASCVGYALTEEAGQVGPPVFPSTPDGACPEDWPVDEDGVTYTYSRNDDESVVAVHAGAGEYNGIPVVRHREAYTTWVGDELSVNVRWELMACHEGAIFLVAQVTWLPEELEGCVCEGACGGAGIEYTPPVAIWWDEVPDGVSWESGDVTDNWIVLSNDCVAIESEREQRDGVWGMESHVDQEVSYFAGTVDSVRVDVDCASGEYCWSYWLAEGVGEVAFSEMADTHTPEWTLASITPTE